MSRYIVRQPHIDPMQLARGMQALPDVLKRMGFSSLRPGQDQCVNAIMAGRDTIGILPTSTGKSLCFTVPGLALGWRTLVFSPLISLMRDQEQSMAAKGVRVGSITSHNPALGDQYIRQWMRGDLDMLYVAPERLKRDDFMQAMRAMPPHHVTTDEAHALSAWSTTFRHAYCCIGDLISELNPQVVSAFSATLPKTAEDDVRRVMCIEEAHRVLHYPRRTNLDIRSSTWRGTPGLCALLERTPGSAIIYCASQAGTEELAADLQKMTGQDVGFYHGGLNKTQRNHTQDQFQCGQIRWLCATNAFGMGVDKGDIRLVVHRDITGSVEAAAQEIGRGGRDGKYSLCHTFFDTASVNTHKFLIDKSNPSFKEVKTVYDGLVKAAGSDGIITTSPADVCQKAGLKVWKMDAILQVLSGAQVIDRCKSDEKICSLRLKNRIDDPKLSELMDVARLYGDEAANDYLEVDIIRMARELDVSEVTLKGRLKGFAKLGVIDYVPPERAKPVKVQGSLQQVDGETVDGLRAKAQERLQQTITFARDTPDEEKHGFLEHHLGISDQPGWTSAHGWQPHG